MELRRVWFGGEVWYIFFYPCASDNDNGNNGGMGVAARATGQGTQLFMMELLHCWLSWKCHQHALDMLMTDENIKKLKTDSCVIDTKFILPPSNVLACGGH